MQRDSESWKLNRSELWPARTPAAPSGRRRRPGRRPARLGPPRPRPRLAGLHRHPRSLRHHAGRRRATTTRSSPTRSACASEFVVAVRGASSTARRRRSTRRSRPAQIEVAARRDPAAERGEDAAVPDHRRRRGLRGNAAELPLSRSAPPAHAAQHDPAAPRDDGDPAVLRRAGLSRDRDADADEVHAGRRARLSRAEPRPPGRVLRAAAVAADLQADPDDRRAGPLLPDRQVLPRRGPARRSAAGVHAGRPRDLVRDRGPRLRDRSSR